MMLLQVHKLKSQVNPAELHVSLYFTLYSLSMNSKLISVCLQRWCVENFVQERNLSQVEQVRKQLRDIAVGQQLRLASCGTDYDLIR